MQADGNVQLTDLRGVIHRRGRVVVFTALLVSLVIYWIAMALPNEYESYATVLVEPQTVDPDIVEVFDILSEAYEAAAIYGVLPPEQAVREAAEEARAVLRAR